MPELHSSRRLEQPRAGRSFRLTLDPEAFARISERAARFLGTGRYLAIQTIIVFIWIALNIAAITFQFDPYPFILLNLVFSTQAAYAAPLILLAQNREPVGLGNSVRWFELGLRLKRSSGQHLFLNTFKYLADAPERVQLSLHDCSRLCANGQVSAAGRLLAPHRASPVRQETSQGSLRARWAGDASGRCPAGDTAWNLRCFSRRDAVTENWREQDISPR
jgi:hypothetical protein